MAKQYDVVIVGAGPAGIFAAFELVHKDGLKVLMLEKGQRLDKRVCPSRARSYQFCKECALVPCAITSGWGGAGAFSDGKLTLSPEVGGWLTDYVPDTLDELIDYVDRVYTRFGAPERRYGTDAAAVDRLVRQAEHAGLELMKVGIKHLGTEKCWDVLEAMRRFLEAKVDIETGVAVKEIITSDGTVGGVRTADGRVIRARSVVVAPGREGAQWLADEAARLGLKVSNNAVDIGVRVELPAAVMEPLTRELHESKIVYRTKGFNDKVRTFCMNPGGEVTVETYGDTITVNGHSYADAAKKTENTNFAILVSTTFTHPFREPLTYGKYVARLANLLGDGILVQRLGDLKQGRRSTDERIRDGSVRPSLKEAAAGDLSFALPYRYVSDILEMIEALDALAPGVDAEDTLLYGVEVKFYSSRLELSGALETDVHDLYAIGDGAGVTRGLVQSSCAGVIAARSILEKAKHNISAGSSDQVTGLPKQGG